MVNIRRTRLRHIWRFLPDLIKESLYPKQVEPPRTYYNDGTLYLYYKSENSIILVIRELININEIFKNKVLTKITEKFNEQISIYEKYVANEVNRLIKEFEEDANVIEKIKSIETVRRIYKFTDAVDCVENLRCETSNKVVQSFGEVSYVRDSAKTSSYNRIIEKFVEKLTPIELIYPAKIRERKFWLFRDKVYVLDGWFGGYPSPEYSGKMQYFRIITEKVFPLQYSFNVSKSIRETESPKDTVTVIDSIDTKIIQRILEDFTENIDLKDIFSKHVVSVVRHTYEEKVAINEIFMYLKGKLIPQSLSKTVGFISLEHIQLVNYETEELQTTKAVINISHEQIINYLTESLTKEVANVRIEHEQVINYVTQSLTKEVANVEIGHK